MTIRRKKKLQKERGEALMARHKCRQAEKELEELNAFIESLETEKKKLEGCEAEYTRLYKQKLQIMIWEHGPLAERIMELVEDLSNAKTLLKNIQEAITAGEDAKRYLGSAQDNLRKAEMLAVYDMANTRKSGEMLTGIIAGYDKYNHIESAAIDAGIAESAISGFKSRLADIDIKISNMVMSFNPNKRMRHRDIWHDRMMRDWYVQKSIEGSLSSVNISKEDVQEKVTMLKTLEFETQRRLNELKSKLDYIVLGRKPDKEDLSESIKDLLE
jgi:hypothetical protein